MGIIKHWYYFYNGQDMHWEDICTNMIIFHYWIKKIEKKKLLKIKIEGNDFASDDSGTQYLIVERMHIIITLHRGVYAHRHLIDIEMQFSNTWMDSENEFYIRWIPKMCKGLEKRDILLIK